MNKNDTITVIRSLLSSTNSSYSIYKLNSDFKKETGINIPLFGYNNIADFLLSIPHTVKVTGIYPIQEVCLVGNQKSAHIVSLVKRQKKKKNKPFHKRKSAGERTKNNQEVQKFKRKPSVKALKGPDNNFNKENTSFEVILKQANTGLISSNSTEKCDSLENYLGIEETIPHIEMQFIQVGDYIEVCPCQICSPHKFYFHFRKCKKKISDFMDNLQTFYAVNEGIPKIAQKEIRPKMLCAVFYKVPNNAPMWHRAQINKIINSLQIVVDLIDNGAAVKVSSEKLKYLHRNFMSLPRQAVLGSLANIRPYGGSLNWSREAIKRFSDLSLEKDLIAGVVHVDPKDFCMTLALSYTKGSEIHINDTLVKEGFAEFDTDFLLVRFDDVLKISNPSKTAKENDDECNRGSDETNHSNKFTEYIANSLEANVSKKLRAPVFYLSNNCTDNRKLKKMFSSDDDKKKFINGI